MVNKYGDANAEAPKQWWEYVDAALLSNIYYIQHEPHRYILDNRALDADCGDSCIRVRVSL